MPTTSRRRRPPCLTPGIPRNSAGLATAATRAALCALLAAACTPGLRHAVARVDAGPTAAGRATRTPVTRLTAALTASRGRPLHWTPAHRDTLALWIDSATTRAWRPELVSVVTDAAAAWRAAGAPLRFTRAVDPTSADVRVHWRRWQEGPERGATTWRMNARGELVGADVTIVLAPGVHAPVSPLCELRAIVLHELGHALGLPHDRSRDSVMYWQTGAASSLTDRDRTAVRGAYRNAIVGG